MSTQNPIFELSQHPATHDVPLFMKTCADLGGYPERPTITITPPVGDPDRLQNLGRWMRKPQPTAGGEGRG